MSIHNANLSLNYKQWPQIQKNAKKGHTESMYLYGIAFLLGGYVEQNKTTAYFWLKKAALKDHADAAFRCGFLMKQDIADIEYDSYKWFEKSAQLGSPAAMCALGNEWTYKKIKSLKWWNKWIEPSDISEEAKNAYNFYTNASNLNYDNAYYYKGLHEIKGWGVKKNKILARETLKNGLLNKDKETIYLLASTYDQKSIEYKENLTLAADYGNPEAQYKLAMLNVKNKNYIEAITWLKRSSIQKYPLSILLLIKCYKNGLGLQKDIYQAYIWSYRAFKMNLISSQALNNIYKLLNDEEKEKSVNLQEIDNYEFNKISDKLFSQPGNGW